MKEQSDTPYYLLACSPYSETAAANPMRAYSKEDCAEIIAHEGGTAYVLAEDYERALATATRERDEARAEVERLRAELFSALRGDGLEHLYDGDCPASNALHARDPECPACKRLNELAATEARPVNPDGLPTYDKEKALEWVAQLRDGNKEAKP